MDKLPETATPTPWYQDEAYWLPEIPDRRSNSVWLALDDVTLESGCMWFVPGSHRQPTTVSANVASSSSESDDRWHSSFGPITSNRTGPTNTGPAR